MLQGIVIIVEDLLIVDLLDALRCSEQSDNLRLRRLPLLDLRDIGFSERHPEVASRERASARADQERRPEQTDNNALPTSCQLAHRALDAVLGQLVGKIAAGESKPAGGLGLRTASRVEQSFDNRLFECRVPQRSTFSSRSMTRAAKSRSGESNIIGSGRTRVSVI